MKCYASRLLCVLLFAFLAPQLYAQSTPWLRDWTRPMAQVRLLVADFSQGVWRSGLQVRLEDGWKTYWRSPGVAGTPPTVDWSASVNLKQVHWLWPTPQRHRILGFSTLGYQDQVLFPLRIVPKDPKKPVHLQGSLTLPVCKNQCILLNIPLSMILNPTHTLYDTEANQKIQQAIVRVPGHALEGATLTLDGVFWDTSTHSLQVQASANTPWQYPDSIIEMASGKSHKITLEAPTVKVSGQHMTAVFPVHVNGTGPDHIVQQKVTVTLINHHTSVALPATIQALPQAVLSGWRQWLWIMGLSLLGGLILNIMPCVLPVLSLKLLGVVRAGTLEKRQIRHGFLASTVGILVSMWLLGLFLIGLKYAGHSIGWGIQFQSPVFLGVMVVLLALFSANMLGLFEIRLPVVLSSRLAQTGDQSLLGQGLQGMLATLLATPCSAPFLVTAIGFALAGGPLTIFTIFTGIGLGLALPFLLIAVFPALAQRLPRPGAWMLRIKYGLGALLGLTLLWMLSLLAAHLSFKIFWGVVCGVLLWFGLLGIRVYGPQAKPWATGIVWVLSITLSGGLAYSITLPSQSHATTSPLTWQPFAPSAIASYVKRHQVVFVDITADWCLTCLANKVHVLQRDPVRHALMAQGVIPMQGDWTKPDSTIADFLARYHVYSIPFNRVYGPGAPNGISLPSLLTSSVVMQALHRAAGKP